MNGRPDDSYRQECYPDIKDEEIPCAGCGEWVLIDVPGVSLDEIFPIHKAEEVLQFGKYKGKKFSEIKDDISYLEWLASIGKISNDDFNSLTAI